MMTQTNVLMITVDQWPGHLFSGLGHPIETPTLDALARSGQRFTNVYSECPICIPARRTLMTGTPPRTHGDRVFKTREPMPDMPTLADTFRGAGYQAMAVGKLHVYPQRDRVGFDDVILAEEGRPTLGAIDDYEMFLADQGYAGQQFLHGMSNNEYSWREWHLSEYCHVTNWSTREMCRAIKRRDPRKPGLWYLSYNHPHPPLVPLRAYLDQYAHRESDAAICGDWASDYETMPHALKTVIAEWQALSPVQLADVRRAFYALCTHIDHQIRLVIGTLREEGVLDNTAILFTADHGDMLGDHRLYAKRLFYEGSARVPCIVVPPKGQYRERMGSEQTGLFGLADIMPTLCHLAEIDAPESCEGQSMLGGSGREMLYGEALEDGRATRMLRKGRHKLIWYPAGNRVQLFDIEADPREMRDLSTDLALADLRADLESALIDQLYGCDLDWARDGRLIGFAAPERIQLDMRALNGQRGVHYPPPPVD